LLKLLRDEPGAETVASILEKASQRDQPVHMTEVNYAEVQYIVRRKDGDDAWLNIANELRAAPIEFHPADRQLANSAADFKARHKISLAGAFAAALAKERKTELVTGGQEFKSLEKEIKIIWLK
jgi:ribonuclease VapC